ncbi:ABC transporter permease [Pelagibius sp. CAU 1746]|uniref:ABC transporter permease n=1 Tax=Pelagibius sp. CAU 1746 TaxID=3140370 RepID=UPI00325A9C0A
MSDTSKTAPRTVGVPVAMTRFSQAGRLAAHFCASPLAVVSLAGVFAILLCAAFAPWISPTNPYDLATVDVLNSRLAPGETSFMGDFTFVLGSDGLGRDILSAIFYGLRTSLMVGITSGVIGFCLGSGIGLVSAYFGGRVDAFVMRIVDLQLSFPTILIALILMATLGRGVDKIILALVIAQWAYFARAIRSAALVERAKEYIEAAECLNLGRGRIIFQHLLPNCLPPLIVIGTVQVAHAIALEATLSFLGVGLPVTEPSLGLLIANGFQYVLSGAYWISVYPGIALLLTIVCINLVGDRLRDVLNPRLSR